jgi:hypothetical protein
MAGDRSWTGQTPVDHVPAQRASTAEALQQLLLIGEVVADVVCATDGSTSVHACGGPADIPTQRIRT